MTNNKVTSGVSALREDISFFHPGFSIDCVILGFHENTLKILLTKYKGFDFWQLPGSFVLKDEDVDLAANRILKELTGLDKVYLRQFYLFGNANRRLGMRKESIEIFKQEYNIDLSNHHWFNNRYITMGYYALVDYTKVNIKPLSEKEKVEWKDYDSPFPEYADHRAIVDKAMETIRFQLNLIPIGRELLPEKFTMTELRILYETLLGRTLNRRNFERKVLSYDYIEKLMERRKGVAYKSPNLFSFNNEKYELAEMTGINTAWL